MRDGYRHDEVCQTLDELRPALKGEEYADLEATLLECVRLSRLQGEEGEVARQRIDLILRLRGLGLEEIDLVANFLDELELSHTIEGSNRE